MTRRSRSCILRDECRLKLSGIIALLFMTALYSFLLVRYPLKIRMILIFSAALLAALLWRPRPSAWLPALPFAFLLGGGTVSIGVFNPSILTLVGFAFFIFYFLDKLAWNSPFPSQGFPGKLFMASLAVQVLSIAVSIHLMGQHPWNAIREGSGIFLFLPLLYIVQDICRTREDIRRLVRSLVLTLLVATAAGMLEYFSIEGFSRVDLSLGYVYRGRIASFLGNANVFAGYLELMIPVALASAFSERSWRWRLPALIASLMGLLCVLYTFSRGGLLFVAIGCGAVFFYRFRRKLWLPLLIGAVFVSLLIKNADVFQRQMSFFLNPQDCLSEPTLLHRYITYRGYLDQISEDPVTGIGWGAQEYYWGGTRIYSFWEVRHRRSSESIDNFGGLNSLVLNQLVKGGVISLVSLALLVWALILTFTRSIRYRRNILDVAVVAGITAMFGHQLVDNLLQWPQISSVFWLLVGMLAAHANVNAEVNENRGGSAVRA